MRKMGIGLGVGINRSNYAQGIFNAYSARVVADGGVVESGSCVDAVSSLLQSASLLLIPSGFKGGKLYSEIPTNGNGDLTWTRGSDAFRTNASGLIQRVPWNLLQRSEELDNAVWTKSNVTVTTNQTTSPDGNLTADLLTPTASDCVIRQSITLTSVSAYTFSVWLRSATGSDISTTIRVWRDSPFQNITNTPIIVTSTWQRFTLNFTPLDLTAHAVVIGGNSTLSSGENLFVFGAQLVEGTTAQTYLPTTDRLNFPRLSYMYGSCPAVLLEPQRTNLALYSQQFDDVYWTKTASSVSQNTTTSPDNTNNADTYLQDASGFPRITSPSFTFNANTDYTLSVYIKNIDAVRFSIVMLSDTITTSWFNLQTYTLESATGSMSEARITNIGNGWYRLTAKIRYTTTTSSAFYFRLSTSSSVNSIDFSKSVYLYGAQLEAGAYPTTYISTTGSATATRVADSFSRNNIYTNGLISASGGTWFVELRGNVNYIRDGYSQGLLIADNTMSGGVSGNGLQIRLPATTSQRLSIQKVISGTNTQLYLTTTDTTKIAIKWNGTTADVFANGVKVVSATAFTPTNMEFLVGSGSDVPKFIQQMALFPTPLSDTDCTTLTTL